MRIRGIIDNTSVNGPGKRTGVWTQGCHVGCSGCVNPETWDPKGAGSRDIGVLDLVKTIENNKKMHDIDGVSFSGGEPLEQFDDMYKTLVWLKTSSWMDIDILVYSGRLISEVKDPSILKYIDIFVDGPFVKDQIDLGLLWRGSRNQKVHLLNDKIKDKMKSYYNLLDSDGNLIEQETGVELILDQEGGLQLTGFSDMSERSLKKLI